MENPVAQRRELRPTEESNLKERDLARTLAGREVAVVVVKLRLRNAGLQVWREGSEVSTGVAQMLVVAAPS